MRMAAGALAVLAFAAPAHAAPRTVIALLPAGPSANGTLLDDFAARGMAIGMTSPTVGGFKLRQMGLDMSQGARIPTRLYSGPIGSLELQDGRLDGWPLALRRASKAPGDLKPGLLASMIEAAGMRVGFGTAGASGSPGSGVGPIVAADRLGRVRRTGAADALDVIDLPAGAGGLRALDRLLAQPIRFVYVVEQPRAGQTRLLASAIRAPGIRGQLRSVTTRRTGLIAATDVAPTVLRQLGLRVPDAMDGEPIEGRGSADPGAVARTAARLEVVTSRRGPTLEWLVVAWAVLLGIGLVAGARAFALRSGLLAVLWLPGLALATAAARPGRLTEAVVVGVGSVVLGALTDRLVRWPLAPAVPAAIVFLAHAFDLVRGSPWIAASMAGPNPAGGARFYGIGNELEAILSVSVLIGAGAALSRRSDRAPVGFALTALVAAGVMGAGRLGADVGAVITLGAGGAAAVVASLSTQPSRRTVALAIAAPLVAVVALAVIDLATGGNGHFTRSVLHAHGSGDLGDIAKRRFDTSFSNLDKPGWAIAFVLAIVAIVWLATRGRHGLGAVPRPFRAGLVGAWFATVVGALANDSGPLILEIGAIYLLLARIYAAERPRLSSSRAGS
jgi:hypothetical protein